MICGLVVGCSSWKCVKGSCCIAPRISKDRAGINGIRKLVFKVYCECELKESSVNIILLNPQ